MMNSSSYRSKKQSIYLLQLPTSFLNRNDPEFLLLAASSNTPGFMRNKWAVTFDPFNTTVRFTPNSDLERNADPCKPLNWLCGMHCIPKRSQTLHTHSYWLRPAVFEWFREYHGHKLQRNLCPLKQVWEHQYNIPTSHLLIELLPPLFCLSAQDCRQQAAQNLFCRRGRPQYMS